MEANLFSTVFLPIALIIIMLGMGLTLKITDFTRIFAYPKAVVIGLFSQLIVLPLVGYGIVWLFPLNPEYAVGIMLIALCPGGPTSNLISHLAKADLALSITLTALSSAITVFTIPILLSFSIEYFLGEAKTIAIPFLSTILKIMAVTIFPVIIGMLVKAKFPNFANKVIGAVNKVSIVFFVLVLVVAVVQNSENIINSILSLGLPLLLLNVITVLLGFFIATVFGIELRQTITISIETGIQNGTLAITIALGILDNFSMALPCALYSIIMFILIIPVVVYGRMKIKEV